MILPGLGAGWPHHYTASELASKNLRKGSEGPPRSPRRLQRL